MLKVDWQPTLVGQLLRLRPLKEEDFESLYAVASDPLIWELHPERNRYQKVIFRKFFTAAIESNGCLVAIDINTLEVLGSSRFTGFNPTQNQIEIGYTFLAKVCWGKGHNTEMKKLMLDYAFQFVGKVLFYIGEKNLRSRKAIEKTGAELIQRIERRPIEGEPYIATVYQLVKP